MADRDFKIRSFLDGVWQNLFVEDQPGKAYGNGATPVSLHEQNKLVSHHRISELLPYEQWQHQDQCCVNDDGSTGFVLEALPATGMDLARLEVLAGMLTQNLQPGLRLQCMLFASPVIEPMLDGWRQGCSGEPYTSLAERRLRYLQSASRCSLFADQPMLLRDFRLFISVLMPVPVNMESLLRVRESMLGVLASAGMPASVMAADDFVNLLDVLLNPGSHGGLAWQPDMLLRQQVLAGDSALFVGRDGLGLSHGDTHNALRIFSVRQYPQIWAAWQMMDLIGDLFSNNLRLSCPFLHTVNIFIPDPAGMQSEAQLKGMRATQMAASPVGKLMEVWQQRSEDWRHVTRMAGDGHKLVQVATQLVLFANQDEVQHATQRLLGLFESRGWLLRQDRFIALHGFLSALPLSMNNTMLREMRTLGRMRTMLSWSAVNTMPWIGEWKGTNKPLLLLAGRRGQLMYFDPFTNDAGNYNIAVAAASGAGKSFFTQELLISLLGTGGRAWVIDSGRSYERLCHLLDGSYLDFSPDRHISLNPFSHMQSLPPHLPLIKILLAQMAAPKQELNSLQMAHLEMAIKTAWDKHGSDTTVGLVAACLLQSGNEGAERVGRMLYPYTEEGVYGAYFQGKMNISLDSDLVVLELGGLDDRADLQQVVLMLLMLHINQNMYRGDRARRKLCIVDEAWRMMGDASASRFIETGYRTARKFGGAYMTITQGLDDYDRSPATRAAIQNSDWVCLLRQKPESLVRAKQQALLQIDEAMLKVLSSLETRQGKYSEVAIMAPQGGLALGRLIVDPFSEKLYSSKADEYQAMATSLAQGMSLVQAIERMVQEAPR